MLILFHLYFGIGAGTSIVICSLLLTLIPVIGL